MSTDIRLEWCEGRVAAIPQRAASRCRFHPTIAPQECRCRPESSRRLRQLSASKSAPSFVKLLELRWLAPSAKSFSCTKYC